MLPFDPRSAVSGERSEGSDDASAPHGGGDLVFGRFRRAFLEMRARSVLRAASSPLVSSSSPLDRVAKVATSRVSVATAAPVAVAPVVVPALSRASAASVESPPRPPIPVAIPVRRGNAGPRETRGTSEPPAVATFSRLDPKPDHPIPPVSDRDRWDATRDRMRLARETTTAAERDEAARVYLLAGRLAAPDARASRVERDLCPARGTKRAASASRDCGANDAGGGKRAKSTPKSVSEPSSLTRGTRGTRGTKGRRTPAPSLSEPRSSSETVEAGGGGRAPPPALRVPAWNLRGASIDKSRLRLDEITMKRGLEHMCVFDLKRGDLDDTLALLSRGVDAQDTSEATRAAAWSETVIAPARHSRPSLAAPEPMKPLGASAEARAAFSVRGEPPAWGRFLDAADPTPAFPQSGARGDAGGAGAQAFAVAAPDPEDWFVSGDLP